MNGCSVHPTCNAYVAGRVDGFTIHAFNWPSNNRYAPAGHTYCVIDRVNPLGPAGFFGAITHVKPRT